MLVLAVTAGASQATAAMLVSPILAASHVRHTAAGRARSRLNVPNDPGLLAPRPIWFAMRTKSAEQALIAATQVAATRAEAHYWLGRIYDFKGNKAEGAFPGFHEEVSYRPRAAASSSGGHAEAGMDCEAERLRTR
jgi:hypothetical protein